MNSIRMARLMAGVCAAAAALMGARADAQDASDGHWAFATGLNYTKGNYGEAQDTTIYAVPFSAGYVADRWSFSVSVPYVWLKGSGNVAPGAVSAFGPGAFGSTSANGASASAGTGSTGASLGSGGLGLSPGSGLINVILSPPTPPPPPGSPPPPPPPTPTTIQEEGIGDTTLSLSVTPYVANSGARFTLSSDFRFPTGDDAKSLGAGETIGSVSAAYAFPVGDKTSLYGAIGWQHAFDSDVSGASAGIGAQTQVGGTALIGASVDWAEATTDRIPSQSEATLYAGFDMAPHTRLVAFALAGLTRTSPDSGFGLRLVFQP